MRKRGFAVDISNWSGYISATQVQRWKVSGVKRVIVGTQKEPIMRQQMHQVYGEDVHLEAYVYLYDNYVSFADQVNEAIRRCEDFPVERLWLDCEFATTAPPDVVVERIQRAIDACEVAGIPYGIYTGQWWWGPMTSDYTGFSHEPLWFANYITPPAGPNIPVSLRAGFGGWLLGVMRQYRGTVDLDGVNVDYNWFDEEEEDVSEVDEIEGLLLRISFLKAMLENRDAALARANERIKEQDIALATCRRVKTRLAADYDALSLRATELNLSNIRIATESAKRRECAVAYARRIRNLERGMKALIENDAHTLSEVVESMLA